MSEAAEGDGRRIKDRVGEVLSDAYLRGWKTYELSTSMVHVLVRFGGLKNFTGRGKGPGEIRRGRLYETQFRAYLTSTIP
jgi:hypothetical protein